MPEPSLHPWVGEIIGDSSGLERIVSGRIKPGGEAVQWFGICPSLVKGFSGEIF